MAVSVGIADTSVFIARETGRPLDVGSLPERLSVSTITVGELHLGVLAASDVAARAARLATLTSVLALEPLPIDESVARAWARVRVELRATGRRMPVNDSWIAATAVALSVPVVTQDDDYDGLGIVEVIKV